MSMENVPYSGDSVLIVYPIREFFALVAISTVSYWTSAWIPASLFITMIFVTVPCLEKISYTRSTVMTFRRKYPTVRCIGFTKVTSRILLHLSGASSTYLENPTYACLPLILSTTPPPPPLLLLLLLLLVLLLLFPPAALSMLLSEVFTTLSEVFVAVLTSFSGKDESLSSVSL